jgi:hypothetical protein
MGSDCRIVTVERRLTAVIKTEPAFPQIPEVQRASRGKLGTLLPSLDCGPLGPTCTRWTPPIGGKLPMEIGVIVAQAFAAKDDVVPSDLPAGRAVHFSMKGPFDGLPGAWHTVFEWCKAQALTPAGINWEIYGGEQDAELYALLA